MKVQAMPETLDHPYAHPPEEGGQILEIDADPSVAALHAHEVVEQYGVDTSTGKLRQLAGVEPVGEPAPAGQRTTKDPKKTKPK